MILVENLKHDYEIDEDERVPALRGVSTRFAPGEFVVVFGHNGSGKSTLARHLNGLLLPTSGRVTVDDLDTGDEEQVWEIRSRVGMVFQNPDNQLIATVVADDIAFGVENLGVPTAEINRRIEEVSTALGITGLLDAEPHSLSGGQKQLVAIAGVLAMKPRYVVLDEPSALLAPTDRTLVLDAIARMHDEDGIGVILITHHMAEAVRADRVLVMSQGEIAMEGTPREVFASVDRLRELRLDVPEPTRIAYELRTRHGLDLPADILTVDELLTALGEHLEVPA